MTTISCARCSAEVDSANTFFTDAGDSICAPCQDVTVVEEIDEGTNNMLQRASQTAIGFGVGGFFCNPGGILTILGFGAAFTVLHGWRGMEDDWQAENKDVRTTATIGLVLLCAQALLILLKIVGMVGVGLTGG